MSLKQISVEQAQRLMSEDPDVIYIDVRTPPEFDQGHPPGAINIPVVFPDPVTQRMAPNPDFLSVVTRHVARSAKVIVGCQMGARSQFAGEAMAGSGYADVSNMQGGFGGARDPMGQIAMPGWLQLGYAVEIEAPAEASYDALKDA